MLGTGSAGGFISFSYVRYSPSSRVRSINDHGCCRFDGDHNSLRPPFFYNSVAIFFHNTLQLEDVNAASVTSSQPATRCGPSLTYTSHRAGVYASHEAGSSCSQCVCVAQHHACTEVRSLHVYSNPCTPSWLLYSPLSPKVRTSRFSMPLDDHGLQHDTLSWMGICSLFPHCKQPCATALFTRRWCLSVMAVHRPGLYCTQLSQ